MEKTKMKSTQIQHLLNSNIIVSPTCIESRTQISFLASELSNLGIKLLKSPEISLSLNQDYESKYNQAIKNIHRATVQHYIHTLASIQSAKQLLSNINLVDVVFLESNNCFSPLFIHEIGTLCFEHKKPIIIERPKHSTIAEFLEFISILENTGNKELAIALGSIKTCDSVSTIFNLTPDLASIIELKQQLNYPIFFCPNKSTKDSGVALELAKAAINIGANGIMVELNNNLFDVPTNGHATSASGQMQAIMNLFT